MDNVTIPFDPELCSAFVEYSKQENMNTLTISLEPEMYEAFVRFSTKELRTPAEQAKFLVHVWVEARRREEPTLRALTRVREGGRT